ncbi:peptidoglycan-binding protein [Streptomyces sp. NPDC089919]|uniref:peptidoglycan-binding domain-containing protein n=1 Tax=Streptomyces sp. NPDC089919 TaxID=3155188 RepID=UPI00343BC047
MTENAVPARLQFRLRGFIEHESTDDFLQGANDEVYMSAVGLDSSSVKKGPDGKPAVDLIHAPQIGDVSADAVRVPWASNPHVLIDFNLQQPGDWPRTYTVTLFIVEHDNGDLAKAFEVLNEQVGQKIRTVVVSAASSAAASLAGAAVGSAIPGIGTVVGFAVGILAGAAYDGIITAIDEGLSDDVFVPVSLTLTAQNPLLIGTQSDLGVQKALDVKQHGGFYTIFYDWNMVSVAAPDGVGFPTLSLHSHGPAVRKLQQLLNEHVPDLPSLAVDGDFGPVTDGRVREYQRRVEITVDGVVGPQTWGMLTGGEASQEAAIGTPTLQQGAHGPAVRKVQRLLNAHIPDLHQLAVDGQFGPITDARVREFQSRVAIVVDGIVGPQTWGHLTQ